MKTIIIYYSLTGNIDYLVEKITTNKDIDTLKLIPKKEYPNKGLKKFFWGGKSAVMGETPELEPYTFDSNKYEHLIIATPVWASTFTPPIRTFIQDNLESIKDKKISVIISYSGGGADKAISKMKQLLQKNELESELILIDPKDKPDQEKENKIQEFINKLN